MREKIAPPLKPRDTTFDGEWDVKDGARRWPEPVPVENYMAIPPPDLDVVISGLLCAASKLVLIGSSKAKKTWFANGLAFCLATGRKFTSWSIPTPRRVLYLNLELSEDALHERSHKIAHTMGIEPGDISGRLDFLHLRGRGVNIKNLNELPLSGRDVVVVDPVYKLFAEGMDENSAGNWSDFLRVVDEVIQEYKCAIVLVHHDPKAKSPDLVNRGAGSGVLGRDADAGVLLDPHADDPNALVVSSYARRFSSTDPFVVRWRDGVFDLDPDLQAVIDSPFQRKLKERRGADDDDVVRQILPLLTTPITTDRLLSELYSKYHLGEKRARRIVNLLIDEHDCVRTHAGKGRPAMLLPPSKEDEGCDVSIA